MADGTNGLWLGCVIFLVLSVVFAIPLAFYVKGSTKDATMKRSNCVMTFWLTLLAFICMWVMWVTCYIHQLYPLLRPTLQRPAFRVNCGPEVCNVNQDPAMWKTVCDFWMFTD